jgi:hypothetical protein
VERNKKENEECAREDKPVRVQQETRQGRLEDSLKCAQTRGRGVITGTLALQKRCAKQTSHE